MAEDIKGKLVVDASAILSRLLPDEGQNGEVSKAFEDYEKGRLELVAPVLLRYEVANALRSLVLSKRASVETVKLIYAGFSSLEMMFFEINFEEVLLMAVSRKISVYDASYLFLAKKLKARLLTLDKRLRELSQ